MRTIIGERRPHDRYDVRSRDCHATDAHVSYEKLSKGTSGGASNLLTQENKGVIRSRTPTKVSHLVSFGILSGLVPRPLARYKSN